MLYATKLLVGRGHCDRRSGRPDANRRPPAATGGRDCLGSGPLERFYKAADGWIALLCDTDQSYRALCGALGLTAGDFASARASQTWRFPPFFHALLDAGVYPPCSAYEAWFVSAALTEEAFDHIAAALPGAARAAAAATEPEA